MGEAVLVGDLEVADLTLDLVGDLDVGERDLL